MAQPSVRLINNQPFAIEQPVTLRGGANVAGLERALGRGCVQADGSNAVFIVDLEPASQKAFGGSKAFVSPKIQNDRQKPHLARRSESRLELVPINKGVEVTFAGKQTGRFTWGVVVEPAKRRSGEITGTRADFAAKFAPMQLVFEKTSRGPLFETWKARGAQSGLEVWIDLKAYRDGFLDMQTHVENLSAPTNNVYAAVICRWEHPELAARTLCYDNRRQPFGTQDWTGFREEAGRHWHMQHGIDWVRSSVADGPSVLWLHPFNQSFTVKAPASSSGKSPARWTGANQAQFTLEAQSVPGVFYGITEIARPNTKSLKDRFRENVLPPSGESFEFNSRLVFKEEQISDEQADNMFVGYTCYQKQQVRADGCEVSFGVPSVRFGTSYFPYSTLGENFDAIKLPGMDRESFWPLAADTVRQWPMFADEIRRDFRMAKWMGFKLIRLHHLELLAPIEEPLRQQYLDFLFGEMRNLQLKALVDVYPSAKQIEELLSRYGDLIDTVEIENEILIWGIPLDRPAYWNEIYAAVKKTAPHVRVHMTAQNNMGAFDRLTALGVNHDRVGLHAYVDSLDALPSARGWGLSVADYATRVGKEPVITEWNWRSLTRMTPENRARIYPQVIEGAVGTRSIPDFYQFQFQETMSPNPRAGRGNILRHYELLNLSRHPKADAREMVKIIEKYSANDDPIRVLAAPYMEVELDAAGTATAKFVVTNRGSTKLRLKAVAEGSTNLRASLQEVQDVTLVPGQSKRIPVSLKLSDANSRPGFYHFFVRLEGSDGFLRYAAGEARLCGKPTLDLQSAKAELYPRGATEELGFDFSKEIAVVWGKDAPVLEAEAAIAIAQTLESATGKLVPFYELDQMPAELKAKSNLIIVGTAKTHALIKENAGKLPSTKSFIARLKQSDGKDWLVVGGADSEAAEKAGMELVLRYWMNAKDSVARRVGVVEKVLPRGIDATKLP